MKSNFLLITTTRHVTSKTRSLVKELSLSIDNIIKINRGKMNILELFYKAKQYNCSRVIIIGRGLEGNPGRITFLLTDKEKPVFFPLILKLSGIKLAREIGHKSLKAPNTVVPIILNNDTDTSIEIFEFTQEFSAAIDRPFLDISIEDIGTEFEKVIFIERAKRRKTKFIIKFYDTKNKTFTGPILFVEKAVYIPHTSRILI